MINDSSNIVGRESVGISNLDDVAAFEIPFGVSKVVLVVDHRMAIISGECS